MKYGGNATFDGLQIYAKNYTATLKRGNTTVRFRNIPLNKRTVNIPVIRCFIRMLAQPLMLFFIMFSLTLEFTTVVNIFPEEWNDSAAEPGIAAHILMFAVYAVFVIVLIIFCKAAPRLWQFHGAEHKVIYAAGNNVDLTLECVRNCPRVAERCGTNLTTLVIPLYILISLIFGRYSLNIFIAAAIAEEFFNLNNSSKLPVLKYFYKVGGFLQKYIVTREPSDEQLEEAIRAMKLLLEVENNLNLQIDDRIKTKNMIQ